MFSATPRQLGGAGAMARMRVKVKGRWKWIDLSPRAEAEMEAQLRRFREKFGRDPLPSEPIFFDPDFDVPTPYDPEKFHQRMLEVFEAAGTPGDLVYAWEKTGMILTEDNRRLFSKKGLRAWRRAIRECRRMHPDEEDEA
jgi:hypothetical protein